MIAAVEERVVDASVVAKWIRADGESNVAAARRLRRDYLQGRMVLVAPHLLLLEVLTIAARRWKWSGPRITRLATQLNALGFVVDEPPLGRVAYWATRGLSAYDACYVALAEHRRIVLVTQDRRS